MPIGINDWGVNLYASHYRLRHLSKSKSLIQLNIAVSCDCAIR